MRSKGQRPGAIRATNATVVGVRIAGGERTRWPEGREGTKLYPQESEDGGSEERQ